AQLWLNGQSLTAWPLNLGVAAIRKEIALGTGNNLLVVKSCEGVGDWYFTARLTDEQGHDAPNVTFDAEIPSDIVPAASAPLPTADMQLIEGFDSIVRFKHTQIPYPDYRGGTESWWSYLHDPESEVVWMTAVPAMKKRTVAVLTASMSEVPFEGELYVNGKFVLPFDLPEERGVKTWASGAYRMTFVYKGEGGGRTGVLLIDIPEDQITPGKPLELRVVPAKGDNGGWFMVKGYKDTLTYEGFTPEQVVAVVKGDWQPSAKP
ncbi:MAG TPA: hypothetical protein VMT89_11085, partial [Candidatus Acidoferrales bacterium]|nr:hypothetical protein [Candidatus Acidoferrales bacterium]